MATTGLKTPTLQELQAYIDGLEWEKDQLEEEVNQLYSQIQEIYHQYSLLGLRDPDTYSIAEFSEIKAAIEQITSLVAR